MPNNQPGKNAITPYAQQEADDAILAGMASFETDFEQALAAWGRQNQLNALRAVWSKMTPQQKQQLQTLYPEQYQTAARLFGGA